MRFVGTCRLVGLAGVILAFALLPTAPALAAEAAAAEADESVAAVSKGGADGSGEGAGPATMSRAVTGTLSASVPAEAMEEDAAVAEAPAGGVSAPVTADGPTVAEVTEDGNAPSADEPSAIPAPPGAGGPLAEGPMAVTVAPAPPKDAAITRGDQIPSVSGGDGGTTPKEGDGNAAAANGDAASAPMYEDVHRLYNPNSGEHFYTSSVAERDGLVRAGWNYEGVGWIAPKVGLDVFRLYNPNGGDHHYTLSDVERGGLVSEGWRYEGVGWHSAESSGLPLYRQYNPNARSGSHNFTVSKTENDGLSRIGWKEEGVGWYGAAVTMGAVVASEDGTTHGVQSTQMDGKSYLFLPSYAGGDTPVRLLDASGVAVAPYAGAEGASRRLESQLTYAELCHAAGVAVGERASLAVRLAPKLSALDLVVMRSAKVETIYIVSKDPIERGRSYVESDPEHNLKAAVAVSAVSASGESIYERDSIAEGRLSTVKGRGNYTWTIADKRPYQLSLQKKADLLATSDKSNANKKWVLLAEADDATMLRNTVVHALAREMGMLGIECAPVDLYYDGVYRGSYLLSEKVEVKPGRVDITDLGKAFEKANDGVDLDKLPVSQGTNAYGYAYQFVKGAKDPQDITGGYLLELDNAYYQGEKCWFKTSLGTFVLKSPELASSTSVRYISEYIQDCINGLSKNRFDAARSFDLDSLAKTWALNEFTKNLDSFFSSTYFHKGKGEVPVYASPLWDFDTSTVRSVGTDNAHYYSYWGSDHARAFPWVNPSTRLRAHAKSLMRDRLLPLVDGVLLGKDSAPSGVLRSLADYSSTIAVSEAMNEVIHPVRAYDGVLPAHSGWEEDVSYLRAWLANRSAWWSDNLGLLDRPLDVFRVVSEGSDYATVFDPDFYLALNHDVAKNAGGSRAAAFRHFVSFGMREGRLASRNFDVRAYRANNADLVRAFGDDWGAYYRHYCHYGLAEGRKAL